MANVVSISAELLAASTNIGLANEQGSRALIDSDVVQKVISRTPITVDSMPEMLLELSGTPKIVTPRSDAFQTITTTQSSATMYTGALQLTLKLSNKKIKAQQALIDKSIATGGLTTVEAWIGQALADLARVASAQWILTQMYEVTAGVSGGAVNTVDLSGQTAPADAINSDSFPAAESLIYAQFGEFDSGFANWIGHSRTGQQIYGIRDGLKQRLYPRNEASGRVTIDGREFIAIDVADASVSGGLLSAVKGTTENADMSARRVMRTYLAKKQSVLAVFGGSPEQLYGNLEITPCLEADGSGTGPGIAISLALLLGVAARTKMPGTNGPGIACLLHSNGVAA